MTEEVADRTVVRVSDLRSVMARRLLVLSEGYEASSARGRPSWALRLAIDQLCRCCVEMGIGAPALSGAGTIDWR